ncbi:MAG: S-methyl-5-thioribose-1-phosphate isomerase [Candidatus Hydrothermarchaeota archaeon]|nr:MAG: S-methyl-5-thioribose-1-phosphate isomerase [Candidatus Hydrothermarchaeota archaeon]
MPLKTIDLKDEKVVILDQTLLPNEVRYIECETIECIAHAIKRLSIRGAPAIGVAAAFALALTALKNVNKSREAIIKELEKAYDIIHSTRPTAVNLFWALDRVMKVARSSEKPCEAVVKEALRIYHEDIAMNKKLGYYGAELIEDGDVILTHCNAGALATAGYGTALGVIRAAWEQGKRIKVIARETRPLLQGARLTAWELVEEGIPVTVICDSSAGLVMRKHGVTKVIVGADRIASNGDTANKIGTYSLAILAREHRIPFYVAAPTSTIDLNIKSGEEIPIEYRDEKEIIYFNNKRIVAEGAEVLNPAFDVTPAKYISAIITEKGLIAPPYEENIKKVVK